MNIKIDFKNDCKELIYKVYDEKDAKIIEDIPIIFSDEYNYIELKKYKQGIGDCIELVNNYNSEKPETINDDCFKTMLGLLGAYFPEEGVIKIYVNAIAIASKRLDIDYLLLTQVVIIHELSHFLSHKFPINNKTWNDQAYIDGLKDVRIHEYIAQLSTAVIINNTDLCRPFQTLSYEQPIEYGVPEDGSFNCCNSLRKELVLDTIEDFRNGNSWGDSVNNGPIKEARNWLLACKYKV